MIRNSRRASGRSGEVLALLWLLAKGYRLRHRNWHGPTGEIDLVLERRRMIVFVEVKLRSSGAFGGAAAAVDAEKRRRLSRTAAGYLSRHELWDRSVRFDVVTVERRSGLPPWRMRHITDAFRTGGGRCV